MTRRFVQMERAGDMKDHEYFVYIMCSLSGTLYIGMTNSIYRRVLQHKRGEIEGFSSKYQRSGQRRWCLRGTRSTKCHPERSISFANAKVMRSRRTPFKHAAPKTRRGILTVLSQCRENSPMHQ